MSHRDRPPDYEDEMVRMWNMPYDEEDPPDRKGIEVNLPNGKKFVFLPQYAVFFDEDKERPMFAFSKKDDPEGSFVLWCEFPENCLDVEETEKMLSIKKKVLGLAEFLGLSDRDLRETIRHVDKVTEDGSGE